METTAIVVMILSLLALIGVVAFFAVDYFKHKDSNDKGFREADQKIETEKTDRLSNLKFVVDQVNDVNTDIFNTMTSNVGRLDASHSNLQLTQMGMIDGMDKFVRFTSNVIPGGTAPKVNLLDLPGTGMPDVQLIQHVTAMMGVTVNDLDTTKNRMEFCNPDRSRCIRIPDESGNTFITSMNDSSRVVVDSALQLNGDIVMNKSGVTNSSPVKISSDGNSMFLEGKNVVAGSGFTAASAKMHVVPDEAQDAFKVSIKSGTNASEALMVSADGSLVTTQPIVMKNSLADANNVARLTIETDGTNNTKYLKIQTDRLHVQGNLSVSGTATVNDQTVATVGATAPLA